jgi:hypothetical protein
MPKGNAMTEVETSSPDETAELAKPEDVTEYVAERQEQENESRPPEDEVDALARQVRDTNPELKEQKKASRYERLKRARDQYKREADELRSRLGQSTEQDTQASETQVSPESYESAEDTAPLERSLESARHMHGDGFDNAYQSFVERIRATGDQATYQRVMSSADPGAELVRWWNEQGNPSPSEGSYESAIQEGRQQQEFQQQLEARDAEIRVQTEARLRSEAFAAQCPDFHETLQSIEGMDEGISTLMVDLIRRSNLGPEIAYLMAKDFWDPDSKGILDHAKEIANDPIAQARFVGALEQVIYVSRNGGSAPMPRATKAPPPLRPVRGGASVPRDIHSLASKDDASDYIAARRRHA